MYGSNTRGFAAAAITGGLIGVSGTAAGLRPVPPSMPLSPTRPENHEPAAPGGRHDSESAVNRIADAGVGAADGRSMQVDFDQQVPRELGHRPPFAPETSGAGNQGGPGGPGGRQWAGGPGVQPGFPRAAGPQQSLFGAAGPGAQFGGQPSSGGQPGQSQPSDAQRFGGQQLGGQLGPAQSGQPQSGSRHVEPRRFGPVRTGQQFGAAHSSAQQPYQGAAATVAIPATSAIPAASATVAIPASSVTAADSATVALAAQRPGPPGPPGPGGAQPNSDGSGQYSSPSPLDRTYELPADERGSRSDCAADPMGGPVRFAEQDSGVARPSMNGPVGSVGSIDDPVDGLETRTGSHRAYSGADGYRSVAELVTATGGGPPIVGSGGRRARPEQPEIFGGPRSVPDMSVPPEYPSDPDLPGSGGYPSVTHLVGTVEYRPISGDGGSGGRRRAPEPMGSSVGTGGYRAVSAQPVDHRAEHGTGGPHSDREVAGTGGYRPVPDGMDAAGIGGTASVARPVSDSAPGTPGPVEGRLRTSFDAYGRVAPEVEFGRSERRPERSGMFIDRAVESSLPTAAVLSQRFSTGGTGGYRAVEPVPEAGERHLAEPRFPRHDTVEPLDAAGRSDRGGGSDRQEGSSALGSLDSSGLFGSLSSRER